MPKSTTVFGVRNVAYYSGPTPDGYVIYYATRDERDAALEVLRRDAIAHGVNHGAAKAGIWPVKRRVLHDGGDVELLNKIEAEGFVQRTM